MDAKGSIYRNLTKEQLEKMDLLECGEDQVKMNRKERRKWYRENKKRKLKI